MMMTMMTMTYSMWTKMTKTETQKKIQVESNWRVSRGNFIQKTVQSLTDFLSEDDDDDGDGVLDEDEDDGDDEL